MQQQTTVATYGRIVRNIALIVASGTVVLGTFARAAAPPSDLLQKIAATATQDAKARGDYTYRQTVTVQDFDRGGTVPTGQYQEIRDITFSPKGGRFEKVVGQSLNTLTKIELTPQDYADIRNIQPFFLTDQNAAQYSARYQGEQNMDGYQCFVAHIDPKQVLPGQRYFEGTLWVRETDFGVVRSEGQAVPQTETAAKQNLFPHFTTIWREVDGKYMFPVETYADDTLFFKDWPERIRVTIRYDNYKKFAAESTLKFDSDVDTPPQPVAPQPTSK